MKTKIIIGMLCFITTAANAAIPYRVEQVVVPASEIPGGNDNEAFAREHRFYIGGMYDFSMWQSYTDESNYQLRGKDTSSFDVVAGIRIYDTFRVEANYARTVARFSDDVELNGDTLFINGIFDARIDSMYRLFRSQHLVPYVGAGIGLSGNTVENAKAEDKLSPAMSVMAGLGIELGEYFTIDAGYRYMYMFSPKFDIIKDFAPTAHQFRVGARINF
ncbi:MAG: porin family protein [Alphaproteobacteria bacterium]|nr:porin family protein [Alphaproteobacteria bacterium]